MISAANDVEMVQKVRDAHAKLKSEIGKVIIGQDKVVDELLMAIFCRSHALLMGVPGLAKTLMIRTLADGMAITTCVAAPRTCASCTATMTTTSTS